MYVNTHTHIDIRTRALTMYVDLSASLSIVRRRRFCQFSSQPGQFKVGLTEGGREICRGGWISYWTAQWPSMQRFAISACSCSCCCCCCCASLSFSQPAMHPSINVFDLGGNSAWHASKLNFPCFAFVLTCFFRCCCSSFFLFLFDFGCCSNYLFKLKKIFFTLYEQWRCKM